MTALGIPQICEILRAESVMGMSRHPGSMVARVWLGGSWEVRQMSAIGTEEMTGLMRRSSACWGEADPL
jgi:hypothetical protein